MFRRRNVHSLGASAVVGCLFDPELLGRASVFDGDQAPFEGPAIVKPPALPEDTYFRLARAFFFRFILERFAKPGLGSSTKVVILPGLGRKCGCFCVASAVIKFGTQVAIDKA